MSRKIAYVLGNIFYEDFLLCLAKLAVSYNSAVQEIQLKHQVVVNERKAVSNYSANVFCLKQIDVGRKSAGKLRLMPRQKPQSSPTRSLFFAH
jgi:hypothetical protein